MDLETTMEGKSHNSISVKNIGQGNPWSKKSDSAQLHNTVSLFLKPICNVHFELIYSLTCKLMFYMGFLKNKPQLGAKNISSVPHKRVIEESMRLPEGLQYYKGNRILPSKITLIQKQDDSSTAHILIPLLL